MRDIYNGLTFGFIGELETFLNEKFEGEWTMDFHIDGKNVDIRLTLDEDEVKETFLSSDNVIHLFPRGNK